MNGLKNGLHMRKLCQKEELPNNIEILNFFKKKLKENIPQNIPFGATNGRKPRGKSWGPSWNHHYGCICIKILAAKGFEPPTSPSRLFHLNNALHRYFLLWKKNKINLSFKIPLGGAIRGPSPNGQPPYIWLRAQNRGSKPLTADTNYNANHQPEISGHMRDLLAVNSQSSWQIFGGALQKRQNFLFFRVI